MNPQVQSDRAAVEALLVLAAEEIDALPWEPVPGCPGVSEKTLWRFGAFTQALVHYDAGAVSPGRPHLAAHHHIWVVSGTAEIAGRTLAAGSYLHVPPQTEHATKAVGAEGCTVLQMHRPHAPREADHLH